MKLCNYLPIADVQANQPITRLLDKEEVGSCRKGLIEKQGVLYTPQLSRAGVCGVMRRKVIETLHAEHLPVCVKDITAAELLAADSVAICNALLGVMPLSQIDNTVFPVSPLLTELVAKQLQDADA